MTLPASFPLSISQINTELGRATTDPFDIQGSAERALAGVPSGAISMSDFLGKSSAGAAGMVDSLVTLSNGGGANYSGTVTTGGADTNRRVVVVIHWEETTIHRTLSSISIGGVSATIHNQQGNSGGTTGFGVAIASAIVPTGTTATVALVMSAAVTTVVASAWRLINYSTLTDSDGNANSGSSNNISLTVSTAAGGVIVAGYTGSTGTGNTGVTWTNATERYDSGGIGVIRKSAADVTGLSAGTLTVSATQGIISNSGNGLVITSWSA